MTPEEMISLWEEEEKHLLKMPDFDAMCPVTPKEYGSRIKELRLKIGVSLTDLGKKANRSYECIRKIELGIPKVINRDLILPFAKGLNCSCSYLLGYTDEISGSCFDAKSVLYLPVRQSPLQEVITINAIINGYRRDPDLFVQCIRALNDPSRERRKFYSKVIRDATDHCHL